VLWQRNQAQLGSGSIAMMLEYASGTEALVSGWSSPVMVKKSLTYIGVEPEQALFVSDNLQTEIATAHEAGVSTVYVLGENRYEDLGASDIHPTYVVDSLKGLFV
jgi:ribonucleotide monophosphatase NagD (HAD superfamily)